MTLRGPRERPSEMTVEGCYFAVSLMGVARPDKGVAFPDRFLDGLN